VLGPLEVRDGGRPIALGGVKQRSVLALLIVNAGEVVSRDRFIDELWGESPPSTAPTALQGYISQLRKALEPERPPGTESLILTREPGYLLAIDPEQLDLSRFERLQANARRALANGDARAASEDLERALGLWRGRALEDLAAERFAADPVRRLEELRAVAIEERFDAELALGRDRELVPEVEAAVAREPLRERLRAQLMLALYRSGRQADALGAYDEARRTLVQEVGIEPGRALQDMQLRILDQDPALELDTDRPLAGRARRRGRMPLLAAGAAAVVAAGLALALYFLLGSNTGSGPVPGNSMAAISTTSGELPEHFPVGGTPTSVAVGQGAVWALNADDQTVTRIDLRTHGIRTFGTGGVPTDIAVGDGSLWVGNGVRTGAQFVGPVATTVSRLDPDSAAVLATVALPRPHQRVSNQSQYHIAVGSDGVWVINPDFSISRIDPATNRIASRIRDVSAIAVATGVGGTWVLEDSGSLARLSPRGDHVTQRVHVPASSLTSIAVGHGAVWATDPYAGTLWRIDPRPQPVERTIPLAVGASDVAYGAGSVWVANGLTGNLSRIDAETNEVTKTIALGNTPGRLSVGDGKVWVAVAGAPGESVPAASKEQASLPALPASVCGRVFFGGGGRPQRLIVSDFPLRGAPALPTQQMSAAIAYVLRARGFRAGRFRVGYQSCDDSTSQRDIFDERKCATNAKAWVGNPLVVGVVGPYNSGCAFNEIPIANRAGLAMISPTNSDVGLTHVGPLTPPGLLARLYPTHERNYARLYPSEDVQGAAAAEFARRRKWHRVYVLDDRGYGAPMAASFRSAARRLGLRVAGSSSWDPSARGYAPLAERVARTAVRAVFVSGLIDTRGAAVIGALRKRLGRGVQILANDGFLPVAALFRAAGGAARGVYITAAGVRNGQLGLTGREFVTRFAAIQRGAEVDHAAVYAAQAAQVLLDAISRSDGSRASVTRALLATHVRAGILGSFGFDARGDPTVAPITIVRSRGPGGNSSVESIDGADVVAVINPRHDLTR
jgi:DNA-binding SARP family transcriptional activator/ABC-type branched-subunit amino acid transport system substrate-binding protein